MTERSEDSTGGYKTVPTFAELAKINVNPYVEKKGDGERAVSYLSWARAVELLYQQDPNASWEYSYFGSEEHPLPFMVIPSGGESQDYTAMVVCTVNAFGRERTCQLPVMDHKNRAIINPTSMEVNTAMQRCLAKAIALHGIGLYIYHGEDLPTEIAIDVREVKGLIDRSKTVAEMDALKTRIQKILDEYPELRGYFEDAYTDRKATLGKKGVVGLTERIKKDKKEDRTNG